MTLSKRINIKTLFFLVLFVTSFYEANSQRYIARIYTESFSARTEEAIEEYELLLMKPVIYAQNDTLSLLVKELEKVQNDQRGEKKGWLDLRLMMDIYVEDTISYRFSFDAFGELKYRNIIYGANHQLNSIVEKITGKKFIIPYGEDLKSE
jgi:hypothetical protein